MQPLWKTVWNFLRKLKMELTFDLEIPLQGLYPKSPKTPIQKNLRTSMFIAAQFIIAMYWVQPKCPSVNDGIKMDQNLWCIYGMEYYTEERKKELLHCGTAWMEVESIMLSEISQAGRDKFHIISPLIGTYSTKLKSKQNIARDIEIKNNLTVTRRRLERIMRGRIFRNNYKGSHGQKQGGA